MAMRRAFRPRRRFIRRRTFGRKPLFARQKFDKIVLFNNFNAGTSLINGEPVNGNLNCSPIAVSACSEADDPPSCGQASECGRKNMTEEDPDGEPDPCLCCITETNFLLINNDTLQSYFQDSVTIVRMYGDIYYRAVLSFPFGVTYCAAPGSELFNHLETYSHIYGEWWNWSLRKRERTQLQEDNPGPFTHPDLASPAYNYDWTESSPPWLWQRQKTWFPPSIRTGEKLSKDSAIGVCSHVTKAPTVVPPFADGDNPGWTDTNIQTSCDVVAPNETGVCLETRLGLQTREPPWHRLRLSSKKHIKMVRDQDLILNCAVRHPQLALPGAWNCLHGSTDFPNIPGPYGVNYQFYLRIAAVVRLN